jgi:hypothetical protein
MCWFTYGDWIITGSHGDSSVGGSACPVVQQMFWLVYVMFQQHKATAALWSETEEGKKKAGSILNDQSPGREDTVHVTHVSA